VSTGVFCFKQVVAYLTVLQSRSRPQIRRNVNLCHHFIVSCCEKSMLLSRCRLGGRKLPGLCRAHVRAKSGVSRQELPASFLIPTRVADTDLQGHVNNVNYYSFMDSAICSWSAEQGDHVADAPRYVVETGLQYHAPANYPEIIEVRFGVQVSCLSSMPNVSIALSQFLTGFA